MAKLSTHVLDLSTGCPAAGLLIELYVVEAEAPRLLRQVRTDADGRTGPPLLEGSALPLGRYLLRFHVADYFRSRGVALPEPPFLDEVDLRFGIADAGSNYHVPLLVTPWSCSTYRGS